MQRRMSFARARASQSAVSRSHAARHLQDAQIELREANTLSLLGSASVVVALNNRTIQRPKPLQQTSKRYHLPSPPAPQAMTLSDKKNSFGSRPVAAPERRETMLKLEAKSLSPPSTKSPSHAATRRPFSLDQRYDSRFKWLRLCSPQS